MAPVDPNSQAALNTGTIAQLKKFTAAARDFVTRVYPTCWPSLRSTRIGQRTAGALATTCFGEYPEDDTAKPPLFLPQGIIRGRDLSKVEPFDHTRVAEYITHPGSYQQGDAASLHPLQGETSPNYTGPNPPSSTSTPTANTRG